MQTGKLADILILDADPIADISVLQGGRHLAMIIKDGRPLDLDGRLAKEGQLALQPAAA